MGDYVREPAVSGRVTLETTLGNLDVELWCKECPLACQSFIQHCLDGYYDDCKFFKVLKDMIALTGDPTNTGAGGISAFPDMPYFPVETNSRLRFRHRGMVGMVRSDYDEEKVHGSQFFITFDKCDGLNGHSTLFGRLTGETLWNAIRINELATDSNDQPLCPPRIVKATVTEDPFNCVPTVPPSVEENESVESNAEVDGSAVKVRNTKSLLSFAGLDDDVEDESDDNSELRIRPCYTNQSSQRKRPPEASVSPVVTADPADRPPEVTDFASAAAPPNDKLLSTSSIYDRVVTTRLLKKRR